MYENRAILIARVSISMKRYAAVKVPGPRGPEGRMPDGPRPVGPLLPESDRLGAYLPRKEVIQPHVPVRLPCYDFTPLTLHTFRVQTTRVV